LSSLTDFPFDGSVLIHLELVIQIEFLNGYRPPEQLDRAALKKLRKLLKPLLGRRRLRGSFPAWVPEDDVDEDDDGSGSSSDKDVDVDVNVAVKAYGSPEDGRRLWSVWKTRLRGRKE
jgi:hypothetical protein